MKDYISAGPVTMNQSEDSEDDHELRLLSPAGAEPAVFRWSLIIKSVKGDRKRFQQDPYDIIDTIRFVREEIPELKRSIPSKTLDNCDIMSLSDVKNLCDTYNQTLEKVLKQRQKILSKKASTELLRHVLELCYNQAVVDPDTLNQYPPFSPEVYGETSFELVEQMIKSVGITAEDRFVDLGSGVGQVVLHVAAATSCSLSVGIEKAHWPALYAKQMELEFTKWMKFYGKSYNKFALERGNFLIENYADLINTATIIFVNNFAFGPDVDHQLKLRFANLKEGARIISSKAFCPLNFHITHRNLGDIGAIVTVKKLSPMRGKVSWTDKPVSYYLHTIDHQMLENFFAAVKEVAAKKTSTNKKRERLGQPVNFSLNESIGSDSCPVSSCSTTPTSTPSTTPTTHRKRTKKNSLRRRLHSLRLSKPAVAAEAAVKTSKTEDDARSSSLPVSEVSSPGDKDKENEQSQSQSSAERESVLVAPLRLRIRTDHHRRRSKRQRASSVVAANETKKMVSKRREHRTKVSAATMRMLDFFHKQVLDTTLGDGYHNNGRFNDAWLSHVADINSCQPKTMVWSKSPYHSDSSKVFSTTCSPTPVEDDTSLKASSHGCVDTPQSISPALSVGVSLPLSIAVDMSYCPASVSTSDKTAMPADTQLSVPVSLQLPHSSMLSSLRPPQMAQLSTCVTEQKPSEMSCTMPDVNADSLKALETLLESFRTQYITMLQVMQTEQYHKHLSKQIQLQQASKARLQSRVSELECEISNQLSIGMGSLHRRLNEAGLSPTQFLAQPFASSGEQGEFHRCAVEILAAHQLQSNEKISRSIGSAELTRHTAEGPTVMLHSPLVDPPETSTFSSPRSLDQGMVVSDISFDITPQETTCNPKSCSPWHNDVLHYQSPTRYHTPASAGINLKKCRGRNIRGSSRRRAVFEEPESFKLPEIKSDDVNDKPDLDNAMECDPEMPVLMAEPLTCHSSGLIHSLSVDSLMLCTPSKRAAENSVKFVSNYPSKYKPLAIEHASSDMPIDLTSPLGRSRRAENEKPLAALVIPCVSQPDSAPDHVTVPVYSPISSTSEHSPCPAVGDLPIASSFLDRFVNYERDSLLQFDPRTSFWSSSFVNNFENFTPTDESVIKRMDALSCPLPIGQSVNESKGTRGCVTAYEDGPMPVADIDHYAASLFNSCCTNRNADFQDLSSRSGSVANCRLVAAGKVTNDEWNVDRQLMDAQQKPGQNFECLTPISCRRQSTSNRQPVAQLLLDNTREQIKDVGLERKVSPDSIRWQQQINSSFEALIKSAYMEADAELPRIDGGESPASVLQSNCHVLLSNDWHLRNGTGIMSSSSGSSQSMRHFECRSDSRDSGLGHDVDRRFDRRSSPVLPPVAPFSPLPVILSDSPVHESPSESVAAYNPEKAVHASASCEADDYSNERLYDALFKKKFYGRQLTKKIENQGLLSDKKKPVFAGQQTQSCIVSGDIGCNFVSSPTRTELQAAVSRIQLFQYTDNLSSRCESSSVISPANCRISKNEAFGYSKKSSCNGLDKHFALAESLNKSFSYQSFSAEHRVSEASTGIDLTLSPTMNRCEPMSSNYVGLLNSSQREGRVHERGFCP